MGGWEGEMEGRGMCLALQYENNHTQASKAQSCMPAGKENGFGKAHLAIHQFEAFSDILALAVVPRHQQINNGCLIRAWV